MGNISLPLAARYLVWFVMTNHVHILATPRTENSISKMMQLIGRHYVRYFNKSYSRTGTLWEGRFKSCVVDAESYLLSCQRYIELNPVRANMVNDPGDYPWSSYRSNGLGVIAKLRTPHEVYLNLGRSNQCRMSVYRDLFKAHIDEALLKDIRESVNKGLALGNDKFKDEVEELTGRRVIPGKRGPKKRIARDEADEHAQKFLL